MEKSKLIGLLKTFSKKEFEELGDFVRSPFHNKLQMVIKLFDILETYYPDFDKNSIEKEKVFSVIYKKGNYKDGVMRNLVSDLLRLAEEFLAYKNIKEDTFLIRSRLMHELTLKRQEILFRKNYSLLQRNLERTVFRDSDYYYKKYQLDLLFQQNDNLITNGANNTEAKMQKHADYLTIFFLISITETYVYMLNEIKVFPERKYEFRLIEEIKNHLKHNEELYADSLFVNLYYNSLMMLSTNDYKFYHELRKLIANNYKNVPTDRRSNIYTLLTNYCQNEILAGNHDFIHEKLEILKESFYNEGQLLLDGSTGYIPFYLIVINALRFKEFEWVEAFINKNIYKVNSEYKMCTYHYCFSLLEYYRGNYGKALEYLSKVITDNYSYKIQIKVHSLMIYYSLNESEQFMSLVDSFKHFLNGNKLVSDIHNVAGLNFINFSCRLFKGREDIKNFNLKAFKKELLETNNINGKRWLIEKTEELEKVVQL